MYDSIIVISPLTLTLSLKWKNKSKRKGKENKEGSIQTLYV